MPKSFSVVGCSFNSESKQKAGQLLLHSSVSHTFVCSSVVDS